MKIKYYSSLLFSAVCALALAACGGRSGGSGGSGGGSDEPSDDPSVETPQPLVAKYLLPEDVVAADMTLEGSNVAIKMRLEAVALQGDVWTARVAHGTITLPAEDLEFEDEGEKVTLNLVSGISLERETAEGIIVRTHANGPTTPENRRTVALQIRGLRVNITSKIDANETIRLGQVTTDQAQIYYLDENGITWPYQLDLNDATITLTNFLKK